MNQKDSPPYGRVPDVGGARRNDAAAEVSTVLPQAEHHGHPPGARAAPTPPQWAAARGKPRFADASKDSPAAAHDVPDRVAAMNYSTAFDDRDMVSMYLNEVGRIPLLTADEEVAIAKRIERGREAQAELEQSNAPPERQAELRRVVEDGIAAREHLILANSRLVVSVAKKYTGRGLLFLDLIQEGFIGLMKAIQKYDYRRGFKFSTYATWWIRQAIGRAVANKGRLIRLPVGMGEQIGKMNRVSQQLTQELHRGPTTEELAEALGVTPNKVESMIQVAQQAVPVAVQGEDDDDSPLDEQLRGPDAPELTAQVEENLLREQLQEVVNTLTPREARVLQLRYGLLDGKVLTLAEVGRKLGITRERARQIHSDALNRLRMASYRHALEEFLRD